MVPDQSYVVQSHGPLARYVKLRFAHGSGMPGTFSPLPRVSDPNMHHGTCVVYVPWCMLGSLTSCFLWNRWWGKRSRHSRRMRNPQYFVSGKRPMGIWVASPEYVDKGPVLLRVHVYIHDRPSNSIDILFAFFEIPSKISLQHFAHGTGSCADVACANICSDLGPVSI